MTQALKSLNLRYSTIIFVTLSSAMTNATPTANLREVCGTIYHKTTDLTKSVLGHPGDEKLAPMVDQFLAAYSRSYKDVPSFERYVERLKRNNFEGDRNGAYNLMQRFHRADEEKAFGQIMSLITAVESFAGPLSGTNRPIDADALSYTGCIRDYVAATIRALPDNSYYDYQRSEVLSKIDPRGDGRKDSVIDGAAKISR